MKTSKNLSNSTIVKNVKIIVYSITLLEMAHRFWLIDINRHPIFVIVLHGQAFEVHMVMWHLGHGHSSILPLLLDRYHAIAKEKKVQVRINALSFYDIYIYIYIIF